jgi:hypothetical protein
MQPLPRFETLIAQDLRRAIMARSATQLRIDENLFVKIKHIAELELRTMNAQMEYFLIKGVQEYVSDNGAKLLVSGYHSHGQKDES